MRYPTRFLEKFMPEPNSGCWLWLAAVNSKGYGCYPYEGATRLAHRICWIYTYGAIPDGLCVLHKCDNPGCVNPEHLFLGTQGDNMRDMGRKGRSNTPVLHGENNGRCKVSFETICAIRLETADDAGVARKYELSRSYVNHLRNGNRRRDY